MYHYFNLSGWYAQFAESYGIALFTSALGQLVSCSEISSTLSFYAPTLEGNITWHPPTPPQREPSLPASVHVCPSPFLITSEDRQLMNLVKSGLVDEVEDYLISYSPNSSFKWGMLLLEAIDLPDLTIFENLWEHHSLVGHEYLCVILRKAGARNALNVIKYALPLDLNYSFLLFKETWISAAKHGSWDVLNFLMEQKVEISFKEWDLAISEVAARGNSCMLKPLYCKSGGFSIGQSERALQRACLHGHLEVVRFLLEVNPSGTRIGRTLAMCKACQAKKLDPEILLELLKQPSLIAGHTLGMLLNRVLKEGYIEVGRLILLFAHRLALSELLEAKELAERLGHGKIFDQVDLSLDRNKLSLIDAYKW